MILFGGKRDPRGRIAQSVKDNVIKILWTWTRGWVYTWRGMIGQLDKGWIAGRIRGELEVGSISGLATLCKSGKLTNNFWLYCLKKGVIQIPLRGGSFPTLLLFKAAYLTRILISINHFLLGLQTFNVLGTVLLYKCFKKILCDSGSDDGMDDYLTFI